MAALTRSRVQDLSGRMRHMKVRDVGHYIPRRYLSLHWVDVESGIAAQKDETPGENWPIMGT